MTRPGPPHCCEPTTYNEPVGATWTCPECGRVYVSRRMSLLPPVWPQWLTHLPGMADIIAAGGTFWEPLPGDGSGDPR